MFEPVSQGDPIRFSARQFNAWNRTAEAAQKGDGDKADKVPGRIPANPMLIKIKNCTGEPLSLFDVIALGDPVHELSDAAKAKKSVLNNGIVFNAVKPHGNDGETICIVLHPVRDGQPTTAIIAGPACCLVEIVDSTHQYAKPIADNSKKLESSETGTVKILSPRTGTGEAFCYVLLGVSTPGESSTNYAGIVMETFGPGEDGRVAIYGKSYPDKDGNGDPIEPVYDIILCDELAGAEDEYPEKIPAGTVLADIRGPDTRPKEGGGEGEVEEIYKAVKTKSDHTGILLSDLVGPASSSTIRIKDAKGVLITLTVYAYYLGENQVLPAGTGIMTYRQRTEGGLRLIAVKSRSAITDTTTG